jgi:hypothetical protein
MKVGQVIQKEVVVIYTGSGPMTHQDSDRKGVERSFGLRSRLVGIRDGYAKDAEND